MTKQLFSDLIEMLSQELDIDLQVDINGACALLYNDELTIQLEPDTYETDLFIGSFISEIPPGKFREIVLLNALKANALLPYIGTLGYSEGENALFLFRQAPLLSFTGKTLAQLLAQFISMAEDWRNALAKGRSAPEELVKKPKKGFLK